MKIKTIQNWAVIIFASLIIYSCTSSEKPTPINKIKPQKLSKPSLFIDFEQNGMVEPSSIEMVSDNQIAILDNELSEVLVFDNRAKFKRRFGSEGKGPGEFTNPRYVDRSPEYINVIDANLYRIIQFDYSGNFEQSYTFEENPYSSTISVVEDGKYFVGSMGHDGSLIKLVDTANDSVFYLGEAMGEAGVPRLEAARQALAGGEIPEIYKNEVTLYYDDNHLYSFLNVYSRIQKYTTEGKLLWETDINLPLNKMIFQRAVDRAKNAPTDVVPSYRFITSMKVVNGETFLFWMPVENQPRELVRINGEGTITNIYYIPEEKLTFADFAISPSLNKLYLTAPQLGQIYQTEFQM